MPADVTEGRHSDRMMRRMSAGGTAEAVNTSEAVAIASGTCVDSGGRVRMQSDKDAGWTVPTAFRHLFGISVRPIFR